MIAKGRLVLTLTLTCSFALLAGCSGGKSPLSARISGKVTYKNGPVKGGTIAFYSENSGVFVGTIGVDGNYSVRDLPPDEPMTVTVDTSALDPNKKNPTYGPGAGSRPGVGPAPGSKPSQTTSPTPEGAPTVKGEYVKIPTKYATKDKTDLKITLKKGDQTKNFDLVD